MVETVFSYEEESLISLLESALQEDVPVKQEVNGGKVNTVLVVSMAKKHAVLPLLYDITKENAMFRESRAYIEQECRQTVMQSYRLLFLTKYVVGLLKEQGIPVMVLKGVATGSFYPVPELRKSGDVDLLVPGNVEPKRIEDIMKAANFQLSKEQHANHHKVFVTPEGIYVEIHTMLAEPFAYKRINEAMEKQRAECWEHLQLENIMGVELPVLSKPFHAYELLLHMLQHFVYAGFGLKLLCDWVVIWRQEWSVEEKKCFSRLVEESGLTKFAEAVTAVCEGYLGLEADKFAWKLPQENMAEKFLREVLDAEDLGNSDANRMVMMSGTGVLAYVKEFHHQMHLNFPKAGNCFLLWPILWVITLVKFLCNNHRVRKTSTGKVLKEAARRSKLMEELKILK